jgi:hypothetical protein
MIGEKAADMIKEAWVLAEADVMLESEASRQQ